MHLVNARQLKRKNASNIFSTRVKHFLYRAIKSDKYGISFTSEGVCD